MSTSLATPSQAQPVVVNAAARLSRFHRWILREALRRHPPRDLSPAEEELSKMLAALKPSKQAEISEILPRGPWITRHEILRDYFKLDEKLLRGKQVILKWHDPEMHGAARVYLCRARASLARRGLIERGKDPRIIILTDLGVDVARNLHGNPLESR